MNKNTPPVNIEAEEAILGGILLDPMAISRIEANLKTEAFFLLAHQEIYRAALALFRQGKPTDLMAISSYLGDRSLLDKVGGTTKLAQLLNRTVSAVNIDRYMNLVMDKYLRRQLIASGHEIVDLGHDNVSELESVLNDSQKKVFQVCQQKLNAETKSTAEISIACFQDLETRHPIYETGLYDLDNLMVGFEPGTLTILAGRPSMGKSAIANFLTLQMATKHKLPVLYFSLEMTQKQLQYRLWSLISEFHCYRDHKLAKVRGDCLRKQRAGQIQLDQQEIDSIIKITEICADLPIFINENRSITAVGIASECRKIRAYEGNLGLIVVDYLQMMVGEKVSGNRSYDLGDVARSLYQLAGEINAPILALSQVSRGVESRQDKRPMMSDLSQSGILEMVADNIIFAYRDEYYYPDTIHENILELILAKARHGDTGQIKLLFDKSCGMIESLKVFDFN
ncbi:replicative DNA helicase [Xenococcus sp. PCC 7305]|uniref:replicative DNA helicase n=1 Tax=Xenococcus sp. PCC 7305 TaxID=102125 RepID=UPI0002ACB9DD|nr:replicative DNA helicase [Xenococcus sp. PCC 7305]ELS04301.1 replicative DNA helicase [Xenococcus sp. PCC 7305]